MARKRIDLSEFFTFTPPTEEQTNRMRNIRTAAGELVRVITENAEACADRGLAIAWARNAMMSANAAVIHGDKESAGIDNELPDGEAPPSIDNEFPPGWPEEPATPDQGLPSEPSYPDNTLPSDPNLPDQGLPDPDATPKKKR